MKIFVAGSGKLATAILSSSLSISNSSIMKWESSNQNMSEKAIIIHAGSGRQLEECIRYCEKTGSILIELSTGLSTENIDPDFTLILCPNTSLLLLKTMHMLKQYGHHFKHNNITIIESHQAAKTSLPGTAYHFAQSFDFPVENIVSVREPEKQMVELKIPAAFLDRHAYHKIVIADGEDEICIETKVLGHGSYVRGLGKILEAVLKHDLEKRKYTVTELIDRSFL